MTMLQKFDPELLANKVKANPELNNNPAGFFIHTTSWRGFATAVNRCLDWHELNGGTGALSFDPNEFAEVIQEFSARTTPNSAYYAFQIFPDASGYGYSVFAMLEDIRVLGCIDMGGLTRAAASLYQGIPGSFSKVIPVKYTASAASATTKVLNEKDLEKFLCATTYMRNTDRKAFIIITGTSDADAIVKAVATRADSNLTIVLETGTHGIVTEKCIEPAANAIKAYFDGRSAPLILGGKHTDVDTGSHSVHLTFKLP